MSEVGQSRRKKTGGRSKGTPNRATAAAREAIAKFVDGNAHRLQGWLDHIAVGVKGPLDEDGNETYLIEPDPQHAFELFMSVIEYHVPKLARVETKHEGEVTLAQRLIIKRP